MYDGSVASVSPPVRSAWSVLRQAEHLVVLGPVGAAAQLSDAARAYMALERTEVQPELIALRDELVATASAAEAPTAARIYAALLLRRVDPSRADALLQAMRGSTQPCRYAPGGCSIYGETLDEVASAVLGVPPSAEIVEPRRLAEDLSALAYAPVWVEPDPHSTNGWARSFAGLLEHDALPTMVQAVERLADAAVPGAIYGAILLSRIDPERALARLDALGQSSERVRVPPRGWWHKLTGGGSAAVADVARDWSGRLRASQGR